MSKNIAKSPEMLQKEATILDLKKRLKKRKTVLKSLKTRLGNTQKNIDDVQRQVHSQLFSKMSELDNLRLQIIELSKQFSKSKNISKEDKEALIGMAEDLTGEDLFGEDFSEYKAQREAMENGEFEFEENFRAKMNDAYAQFRVQPEEKEQRSIRNVFIKLSKKFHPDLAKNDKEAEEFHSMMQEINEAYQNNDIQRLLEFEQMYLIEEVDFTGKAVTIDILQEEINRLERDLDFINGQVERTSLEIKDLRASDMGQMLTSMDKAEREGQGISLMVLEMQESIDQLSVLRDGLKDSIKRDEISPILINMMQEFSNPFAGTAMEQLEISPDMSQEEVMGQVLSKMMSGEVDPNELLNEMMGMMGEDSPFDSPFDIFGDDDDFDDVEEIDDPDLPIDSHVRITRAVSHPFMKKLKMKNWVGTVIRAYYDEEDKETYEILLDAESLKQIPSRVIEAMELDDEDIRLLRLYRNQLAASEPRSNRQEDFTTYRTLKHQFHWNFLDNDRQAERIKNVMLAHPASIDVENWMEYLIPRLNFPFKGVTLGALGAEVNIKVLDFAFVDEDYGIIMNVQEGRRKGTYPLMDMQITDKKHSNYRSILQDIEDYQIWAEDILDE